MSLAQMIRRVAGGKPRRMSDDPPNDGEDEDLDPSADDGDPAKDADGDPDKDAEDGDPDKDAEDGDTIDDDDAGDPDAVDEDDPQEGMSDKEKAAFAKGRRAERKRIGTILGSPRADGNPSLAAHLAFRTADSPKKALATLKHGGTAQASSGRLADRMQARGPSKTGRGVNGDVRTANTASSWDGALAKAGVKMKGK